MPAGGDAGGSVGGVGGAVSQNLVATPRAMDSSTPLIVESIDGDA